MPDTDVIWTEKLEFPALLRDQFHGVITLDVRRETVVVHLDERMIGGTYRDRLRSWLLFGAREYRTDAQGEIRWIAEGREIFISLEYSELYRIPHYHVAKLVRYL